MSLQNEEMYWIARFPGLITYPPDKRPRNPSYNAAPSIILSPPSFFQRISVFHLIERSCSSFPSSPSKLGHIEVLWKRPTYRQLETQILELLDDKAIKFERKVEMEIHWTDEDVSPTLLNAEVLQETLEWMKKTKWKDRLVVKLYLNKDYEAVLQQFVRKEFPLRKWYPLYRGPREHDTIWEYVEAWSNGFDVDIRHGDRFTVVLKTLKGPKDDGKAWDEVVHYL
jgi:hypothetical protein